MHHVAFPLHKGPLNLFMRQLKAGLNQGVICRFSYLRNQRKIDTTSHVVYAEITLYILRKSLIIPNKTSMVKCILVKQNF